MNIWAASWQNQQNDCAPSKDSDQPGHPPSLIRVFAVHMKEAWVFSYPLSAQWRLWSDWADAQVDLSLCWAHSHFVGFVTRRLIYQWSKVSNTRPVVMWLKFILMQIEFIMMDFMHPHDSTLIMWLKLWDRLDAVTILRIWATSWENLFIPYANNKGGDQLRICTVWSAPLLFAA